MADSPQDDDVYLLEQILPTGDALNTALNCLEETGQEYRAAIRRVEHLATYLAGLHYSDCQYRQAAAEIWRLENNILPHLERRRTVALGVLTGAHYPSSIHR